MENKKDVTGVRVQPANVKDAMRVVEEWTSMNRLLMHSDFKDDHREHD